jgi:hypothetical protein
MKSRVVRALLPALVLSLLCFLVLTAAAQDNATLRPATPAPDSPPPSAYDARLFPNFYALETARSRQANGAAMQDSSPDLDVAYISRTPRYDYDAPKNKPAPGDVVTFQGRVVNRGDEATGTFAYTWRIDATEVQSGTHPSLTLGEVVTLTLEWIWQDGPHTVALELDPADEIPELSEQNNIVEDRTNALAVGFWVEQSVYDWFITHQYELGIGSVSWDDWAQRQLRYWNQMFIDAVHPLTPDGIVERVRLDQVTIIPDGTWPDCSNRPNVEDKTVDLVWGFVAEQVGVSSGHTCGEFNFYVNHPEFQVFEPPLLHEMSHARYLVDLYGLNVYVNAARLVSGVDENVTTLEVDRDIESDGNFPIPAYLAVEEEMIICQTKSGNTFGDCARGAEGTTPRSHAINALVNLATVRLQDGQGNLIQGSAAMPVIGWDDHLYYNRYPDDLMSGGLEYGQHSAYAWNRIAGQRPICGNYNAPCNIGEYLNDIPQQNFIELRRENGEPLVGARVAIHNAKPFPVWYGKVFLRTPDMVSFTNTTGRVALGSTPFGTTPYGDRIVHTWGYSNADLLLAISAGGGTFYHFFEVTEVNEAYWAGNVLSATYVITTPLPQGTPPKQVFLPLIVNTYPPPPPLLALHFEDTFTGADGEEGEAYGPTFVPGYNGQGVLFDIGGTFNVADTLHYATAGNIIREQGRIEFWLKPAWDGDDMQNHAFFEVGDTWLNRIIIMKDGANNFRFIVWSADTEYGVAINVGHWNANEWHHVQATWEQNSIALSLDDNPFLSTFAVLPSTLAERLYIGSSSSGDMSAEAVMDEFFIHGQAE